MRTFITDRYDKSVRESLGGKKGSNNVIQVD